MKVTLSFDSQIEVAKSVLENKDNAFNTQEHRGKFIEVLSECLCDDLNSLYNYYSKGNYPEIELLSRISSNCIDIILTHKFTPNKSYVINSYFKYGFLAEAKNLDDCNAEVNVRGGSSVNPKVDKGFIALRFLENAMYSNWDVVEKLLKDYIKLYNEFIKVLELQTNRI